MQLKIKMFSIFSLFYQIYHLPTITAERDINSVLYCMNSFTGVRNPIELPNDRCCPNIQEEFIQGTPYSSTRHGCCGSRIYDLFNQVCCSDYHIVSKNENLERPVKFDMKVTNLEDNTSDLTNIFSNKVAELEITWSEVVNADTYELQSTAAFNSTWNQPEGTNQLLGTGDTMGTSISVLENLLIGYSYMIKVRAFDCLDRPSEWLMQKIKVRSDGQIDYM